MPESSLPNQQPTAGFVAWISPTDHKHVGVLYMLSALVFFLIGGMEAMTLRAQLALPNLKLLTPELYNQVFTMHGTTMIFLVVVPVLTGFGLYMTPLMIGATGLAFLVSRRSVSGCRYPAAWYCI